jgi:RNA polymerase sigma factor (sigma-70 family)
MPSFAALHNIEQRLWNNQTEAGLTIHRQSDRLPVQPFGKKGHWGGGHSNRHGGRSLLLRAEIRDDSDCRPDLQVTQLLPTIRRYLSRRVPAADVDDLVQDVVLRLHSRRSDTTIDNPAAYLFQVAHSVLTDHARRNQVRHRSAHQTLENDHHPVEVCSPDRVLQGKEDLAQLVAAIGDLPERTRQAFVLHRFEEMSYTAIARHMGISVSAVEKHIMKAIRILTAAIA